ncbi:hypothetical protein GCM10027160_33040 [Streptomyces calidiresistens]|uniref:Uncharacterized protein n=1 Tax=Streptomyces calidiresistens TaxID=1485586 RepID=A0A7W3T5I2_9ACTN|nr:hypothetical protein [Streptomyces calidiresistens]MBB0231325.1 hypothetical protein [Streptomyces calidiresistens]
MTREKRARPPAMAGIARRALEGAPARGPSEADLAVGPVAADVWIRGDLGFVLVLHRRDDGFLGEEVYHSFRDPEGGPEGAWSECDHLGGSVWRLDPKEARARGTGLANGAPMVVTDDEVRLHTGRASGDEGWEPVRIVVLLAPREADALAITGADGTSSRRRPPTSPLALVVLLPGDRVRVRATRSTGGGHVPVGEPVDLDHTPPPDSDPDPGSAIGDCP